MVKYFKFLGQEFVEIKEDEIKNLQTNEIYLIRYDQLRIVECYPHPDNPASVITVTGTDRLTTRAMEEKIKSILDRAKQEGKV